jgi:biotin carboxyl carrier protein
MSPESFEACKQAHAGFQLGNELLLVIPALAHVSEFDQVSVDPRLEVHFPKSLADATLRAELQKSLSPAPLASSDEIVTPTGGHFYSREAPHLPQLAHEGMHFAAGQPLFVIEVMKMFNKVSVPFSGTITKLLLPDADGKIVQKGELVFKIEPDDKRVEEAPEAVALRRRTLTDSLMQ